MWCCKKKKKGLELGFKLSDFEVQTPVSATPSNSRRAHVLCSILISLHLSHIT